MKEFRKHPQTACDPDCYPDLYSPRHTQACYGRFVRWLMLAVLVGCAGRDPVGVDAGDVDAAACPPAPTVGLRDVECKTLCGIADVRCMPGQTGGECWNECMVYGQGTTYCPGP